MNHVNKRSGFTLIELLLAMTFISVLLLAIAMTILQISAIYNRGMILKEVNQIGRTLSSELQGGIIKSVPFSVSQTTGSHFFEQTWGGRLCLGQYSYIWNYGSALQVGTSPQRNLYQTTGQPAEPLLITATSNPIRFVKVYDTQASYCGNLSLPIDPANATELLNIGDHSLAVHDFSITTSATADDTKTGQRLYNITFIIGTNELGTSPATSTLLQDMSGCKGPGVPGADLSYCVVQKFSIAIRAGNMVQ